MANKEPVLSSCIDWAACLRCIDKHLSQNYRPVALLQTHALLTQFDRVRNFASFSRYADTLAQQLHWCPDPQSVAAMRATACLVAGPDELYNSAVTSLFPVAAMALWWHRVTAANATTTATIPEMLTCTLNCINDVMKDIPANSIMVMHRRAFIKYQGKQLLKRTTELHVFYMAIPVPLMNETTNSFSTLHTMHVVLGILYHSQIVCVCPDADTPRVACNIDVPDAAYLFTTNPHLSAIHQIITCMYQQHDPADRVTCFKKVLGILECDFPDWDGKSLDAVDRKAWNLAFLPVRCNVSRGGGDAEKLFLQEVTTLDQGWIGTGETAAQLWKRCNLTNRMDASESLCQQFWWLLYHYESRVQQVPAEDRVDYCKQMLDNNIRGTFGRMNDHDAAGIVGFCAFLCVVSKCQVAAVAAPVNSEEVSTIQCVATISTPVSHDNSVYVNHAKMAGLNTVSTALQTNDPATITDPVALARAATQLETVSLQVATAMRAVSDSMVQLREDTVGMLESYMTRVTAAVHDDAANMLGPEVAMRTNVVNMVAVAELCMRQFFGSLPRILDEHLQRASILSAATADSFAALAQTHGIPVNYSRPWAEASERCITAVANHGMPLLSDAGGDISLNMPSRLAAVVERNQQTNQAVHNVSQTYQHLAAQSLTQYMNSRDVDGDDASRRLFLSAVGESVAQPLLNRMFDVHHPALSALCQSTDRDAKLHLRMSSGLFSSTVLHTHHHMQIMYTTSPLVTFMEVGAACGLSRPDLWSVAHRICDVFYRHMCRDVCLNMLVGQMVKVNILAGYGSRDLARYFLLHKISCCRTCQLLPAEPGDGTIAQFLRCPDVKKAAELATQELDASRLRRIFNAMPPSNFVGAIHHVLHVATTATTVSPVDVTDFYALRKQIPELESEFMTTVESNLPDVYAGWQLVPPATQMLRAYPVALRGLMVTAVHLFMREEPSPLPNYLVRNHMYDVPVTNTDVPRPDSSDKDFIRTVYDSLYTTCPVYQAGQDAVMPPDDVGTVPNMELTLERLAQKDIQEAASNMSYDMVVPPRALQFAEATARDPDLCEQWAPHIEKMHRMLHQPQWTVDDLQDIAETCACATSAVAVAGINWTDKDSECMQFRCTPWLSPASYPPAKKYGRVGRPVCVDIEDEGYCTDADVEVDTDCILRHYNTGYGGTTVADEIGLWERCAEAARVFAVLNPANSRPSERDTRARHTSDTDNAHKQNESALFEFERTKHMRPDGWDAEADAFAKRHKTYM